jgi:hypothetical protein
MIEASRLLTGLPSGLRDALLSSYREIAANFAEHRWEPSELNGGKFCEVVYTVLDGALKKTFASTPSKPKNMADACWALEDVAPDSQRAGDRSLRILIPRVLLPLYEIRNNRGVGHVGGDVNPNFMDATAVYSMASWVLAELVRIFHGVDVKEAQASVDALVERKHPLIWEIEGAKRVLDTAMPVADQCLVLLYQNPAWVLENDLISWVEYSNPSVFRSSILLPLHKKRFIEYDRGNKRAHISPVGIKEVEVRILKTRER